MPRKAKAKVNVEKPPPKKRGRKPKKKVENEIPLVPKKRGVRFMMNSFFLRFSKIFI